MGTTKDRAANSNREGSKGRRDDCHSPRGRDWKGRARQLHPCCCRCCLCVSRGSSGGSTGVVVAAAAAEQKRRQHIILSCLEGDRLIVCLDTNEHIYQKLLERALTDIKGLAMKEVVGDFTGKPIGATYF